MRDFEPRLPGQDLDLSPPVRPHQHQASLAAGNALATGEAEQLGGNHPDTRLFPQFPPQGLLDALAILRPASRKSPMSTVRADQHEPITVCHTDASGSMRAASRRIVSSMPRDQPVLTAGMRRHLFTIAGWNAPRHAAPLGGSSVSSTTIDVPGQRPREARAARPRRGRRAGGCRIAFLAGPGCGAERSPSYGARDGAACSASRGVDFDEPGPFEGSLEPGAGDLGEAPGHAGMRMLIGRTIGGAGAGSSSK